MNVDIGNYKL